MCDLDTDIDHEGQVEGWKVVAVSKKTGRYYSIAMGFVYRKDYVVPKVKRQRRIGRFFNSGLLTGPSYREAMEGRTAVFRRKGDADNLLRAMSKEEDYSAYAPLRWRCDFKVVKARVWGGLLAGYYPIPIRVVAGKRIKFLS